MRLNQSSCPYPPLVRHSWDLQAFVGNAYLRDLYHLEKNSWKEHRNLDLQVTSPCGRGPSVVGGVVGGVVEGNFVVVGLEHPGCTPYQVGR